MSAQNALVPAPSARCYALDITNRSVASSKPQNERYWKEESDQRATKIHTRSHILQSKQPSPPRPLSLYIKIRTETLKPTHQLPPYGQNRQSHPSEPIFQRDSHHIIQLPRRMFPEIMTDSAQAYERRASGDGVAVVGEGDGDAGTRDEIDVGVGGL